MGKSKYTVTLTEEQKSSLEELIRRGKSAASTIRHAYILLHADKPDPEVAEIRNFNLNNPWNISVLSDKK